MSDEPCLRLVGLTKCATGLSGVTTVGLANVQRRLNDQSASVALLRFHHHSLRRLTDMRMHQPQATDRQRTIRQCNQQLRQAR